jgi:MerR family transcriptional regulator, light-induced transcriptional regulator
LVSARPRVVRSRASGPELTDLSGPLLVALLGGDEVAVEELLARARVRGADTALLVRDLVMPALCEVGRMWTVGQASIAEEHLATNLVGRVLARSSGGKGVAACTAPRVVLACLEGEFHDLGIRFLADVAREEGWDAESLGANVPHEALVRFVSQRPPAALALSVALAGHVPEAARTIAEVRAVAPGLTILVGGRAFLEDAGRIGLTGADAGIADAVAFRDWLRCEGGKRACATPNGRACHGLPAVLPPALRRKLSRSR